MKLDKILKTRNEVRINCEKGGFITSIDEIISEDTLTILAPLEAEHRLLMKPGGTYLISCVTELGLYMFETVVDEVRNSENVPVIVLKAVSDYKKIQRREAFRATENISVSVRRSPRGDGKPEKWVNTHTVDISEMGTLLKFNEECAVGQAMELVLRIDVLGIKEILPKVKGRVARCRATGSRQFGYLLGIQFEELPEKARSILIKLVVLSQRSKLTYQYTKRYK